jgi:hypothetical protein
VKRPSWRVLVPALVAVGLLGGALPAFAGELGNDDSGNNRLKVRMSLHCNSTGSVRVSWHSIWPKAATHMSVQWFDATTDPDLAHPASGGRADHNGDRASGAFTIPAGHNRHRMWLFVDALDKNGNQVFGIGRVTTVIHC